MLRTSNLYKAHAEQSMRSIDAVTMPLAGLSKFEKPAFWTSNQRTGTSGVIP